MSSQSNSDLVVSSSGGTSGANDKSSISDLSSGSGVLAGRVAAVRAGTQDSSPVSSTGTDPTINVGVIRPGRTMARMPAPYRLNSSSHRGENTPRSRADRVTTPRASTSSAVVPAANGSGQDDSFGAVVGNATEIIRNQMASAMDCVALHKVAVASQGRQMEAFCHALDLIQANYSKSERDSAEAWKMEARNFENEAQTEHTFAEVYANAVTVLGQKAISEMRARDAECFQLKRHNHHLETRVAWSENQTRTVIGEARERILADAAQSSRNEQTLSDVRSELLQAQRIAESQQQRLMGLEWISQNVPEAEKRFEEVEARLRIETEAYRFEQTMVNEMRSEFTSRGTAEAALRASLEKDRKRLEDEVHDARVMIVQAEKRADANMMSAQQRISILGTELADQQNNVEKLQAEKSEARESIDEARPSGAVEDPRLNLLEAQMFKQSEQIAQLCGMYSDWYSWSGDTPEKGTDEAATEAVPISTEGGAEKAKATSLRVITTLAVECKAGDAAIHVASMEGFKIGQIIRIGWNNPEDAVVKAFGSLVLEAPLSRAHPAGSPVGVVRESALVATSISFDDDVEEEEASPDLASESVHVEGYASDSSVDIKVNSGPKKYKVPKIPRYRHEVREYHVKLVEAVLQVSTRSDEKEKKFLDEIFDLALDDERLDHVPKRFAMLNRALRPVLEESCEKERELADEIKRHKLLIGAQGKLITARRIIKMIYENLATDSNMMEVVTIRSLTDLRYEDYGDAKSRQFYSDWIDRVSRLDCQLDDNHKRDILFGELKKSSGLKISLQPYKMKDRDARTYQDLLRIYRTWLQETKEDENLKREMGGGSGGNKNKANAAKNETKGDKGGKGAKGKDKGNTKVQSSAPPPQKNEETPLCAYYQTKYNGGKTCHHGDNCRFRHDEAKNKAEYDALFKPWEFFKKSREEDSSGSANPGSGARKRTTSPMRMNWELFCKKGLECPGYADRSCQKIHCSMDEANWHISQWKDQDKGKGKSKGKDSKNKTAILRIVSMCDSGGESGRSANVVQERETEAMHVSWGSATTHLFLDDKEVETDTIEFARESAEIVHGLVPYDEARVPRCRHTLVESVVDDETFAKMVEAVARMKAHKLFREVHPPECHEPWPTVEYGEAQYVFDGEQYEPHEWYEAECLWPWFDQAYHRVKLPEKKDDGGVSLLGDGESPDEEAGLVLVCERPTRVNTENKSANSTERLVAPKKSETEPPVCTPEMFGVDADRVLIIDSGSTANVLNKDKVKARNKELLRPTVHRLTFDTANSQTCVNRGLRARVGEWDCEADYVLMDDSPELLSLGERCMNAGYTFVWVEGKHPCFVSQRSKYITVLDVDGVLPIWSPGMEKGDGDLGTFELWRNDFREKCGVYLNDEGQIIIDRPKCRGPKKRRRQRCHPSVGVSDASREAVGESSSELGEAETAEAPTNAEVTAQESPRGEQPLCVPCEDGAIPDAAAPDETKGAVEKLKPSRMHLLDHAVHDPNCMGCQAKARNKKHFKGTLDRSDPKHKDTISMDQVSIADLEGTAGIGGYRYALVLCKVAPDYSSFVPLRSMESGEALIAFREFCRQTNSDTSVTLVHCDAHRSLVKICTEMGVSRKHSPPARPQANGLIERKIGSILAGIRASLASGCLPGCFWPFAGRTFAVHCNQARRKGNPSAYEGVTGNSPIKTFVFGQLCFYKPAPTVWKSAKIDASLRPGVFLDYYFDPSGRFSGQYVVCDLEDFAGKNLNYRIGPQEFKLRLHRTEVVRDPIGTDTVIFPLKRKFWRANYTVEGIEDTQKGLEDDTKIDDFASLKPVVPEKELEDAKAELLHGEGIDFKYSRDGKKLPIDSSGTWIRKGAKNWRPEEVPLSMWKRNPDLHEEWRSLFPDSRRYTPDGKESTLDALEKSPPEAHDGLEPSLDGDVGCGGFSLPQPNPGETDDHWVEGEEEWTFWRMKPSKGLVVPRFGKDGPAWGELVGTRRSEATFSDGSVALLDDWYNIDKYPNEDQESKKLRGDILTKEWTGPTLFTKKPKGKELGSSRSSGSHEPFTLSGDVNVARVTCADDDRWSIAKGKDYWQLVGDSWLRYHVKPRKKAYVPKGDGVTGPDPRDLSGRRVTIFSDGHESVTDDWLADGEAVVRKDDQKWTGVSVYKIGGSAPCGAGKIELVKIGEDESLQVKRLTPTATLPVRGTAEAAGFDLSADDDVVVPAGGRRVIPTGLSVLVPEGTYGRIAPRSGLAVKHGIGVGAGVVDRDYRGEVGVVLFNHGSEDFKAERGTRIAQMILEKISDVTSCVEVEELDETVRGTGGFGSTGMTPQVAPVLAAGEAESSTTCEKTCRTGNPEIDKLLDEIQKKGDQILEEVSINKGHREKVTRDYPLGFGSFVARSVKRSEYQGNKMAMEAYWKEWKNLEKKGTWDWHSLAEWDDVAAAARKSGTEIHFGYLFGIMVEKGSEFEPGDPRRYYKYRVVFQGNNVKDQNWDVALFQELASTPATLEASRCADAYSCFPGHCLSGRDVEQAYLCADLSGPDTYVMLPQDMWTEAMWKMKCPVVKLRKALYGHKNSGAYWDEHRDAKCKKAGFLPVSESWPGVYFNPRTRMLLVVYVDDFKLSGPREHHDSTWAELSKELKLDAPKGDADNEHTFLGCVHRSFTKEIQGRTVSGIEYDVRGSVKKTIEKYKSLVRDKTGKEAFLFKVATPTLDEDTRKCPHRAPCADGSFVECPSCLHTIPVGELGDVTFPSGTTRKLGKDCAPIGKEWMLENDDRGGAVSDGLGHDSFDLALAVKAAADELVEAVPVTAQEGMFNPLAKSKKVEEGKGVLGSGAAMITMTALYPARVGRFDVLKAITALAKRITRWDAMCDKRLHHLMCYLWTTLEYRMVGWIGDDPSDLSVHLACDASFAECPYTLRSSSGCHADIQGPNSRFPWAGSAAQQTSRAQSTPEAELVSLNAGMKTKGVSALAIWDLLLRPYHAKNWKLVVNIHEDNTTAIRAACTGKNPTMKTLERGHGVSVGWLYEQINSGCYNLVHTDGEIMSADIYTKGFSAAPKWNGLRQLINVYSPEEIRDGLFGRVPVSSPRDSESLNQLLELAMSGQSSLFSDSRKAVKVKPTRKVGCVAARVSCCISSLRVNARGSLRTRPTPKQVFAVARAASVRCWPTLIAMAPKQVVAADINLETESDVTSEEERVSYATVVSAEVADIERRSGGVRIYPKGRRIGAVLISAREAAKRAEKRQARLKPAEAPTTTEVVMPQQAGPSTGVLATPHKVEPKDVPETVQSSPEEEVKEKEQEEASTGSVPPLTATESEPGEAKGRGTARTSTSPEARLSDSPTKRIRSEGEEAARAEAVPVSQKAEVVEQKDVQMADVESAAETASEVLLLGDGRKIILTPRTAGVERAAAVMAGSVSDSLGPTEPEGGMTIGANDFALLRFSQPLREVIRQGSRRDLDETNQIFLRMQDWNQSRIRREVRKWIHEGRFKTPELEWDNASEIGVERDIVDSDDVASLMCKLQEKCEKIEMELILHCIPSAYHDRKGRGLSWRSPGCKDHQESARVLRHKLQELYKERYCGQVPFGMYLSDEYVAYHTPVKRGAEDKYAVQGSRDLVSEPTRLDGRGFPEPFEVTIKAAKETFFDPPVTADMQSDDSHGAYRLYPRSEIIDNYPDLPKAVEAFTRRARHNLASYEFGERGGHADYAVFKLYESSPLWRRTRNGQWKIVVPCDKAGIYRMDDVLELFSSYTMNISVLVSAIIHCGDDNFSRGPRNYVPVWKPRLLPIIQVVSTYDNDQNLQAVYKKVFGIQVIQGTSMKFIDPRLSSLPFLKEDENMVVEAAHVTSAEKLGDIMLYGLETWREENMFRRAPFFDERGLGQSPNLSDWRSYIEVVLDLKKCRGSSRQTAAGAITIPFDVHPSQFEKIVKVEWFRDAPGQSWDCIRQLLTCNAISLVVPIGRFVETERKRVYTQGDPYRSCWSLVGRYEMFRQDALTSGNYLPFKETAPHSLTERLRVTPCCDKVQPSEIAHCTNCEMSFVFLAYNGMLWCPALNIYVNQEGTSMETIKELMQIVDLAIAARQPSGGGVFGSESGDDLSAPNSARGSIAEVPIREEETSPLTMENVARSSGAASSSGVSITQLTYAIQGGKRSLKYTAFLRRMYTRAMKNMTSWDQDSSDPDRSTIVRRMAEDGVEPALKRQGSVERWGDIVLEFPHRPYRPESFEAWKAWKNSDEVKLLNPVELHVIRVAYRNYSWYLSGDRRFEPWMYTSGEDAKWYSVNDRKRLDTINEELDSHLAWEIFWCKSNEFPGTWRPQWVRYLAPRKKDEHEALTTSVVQVAGAVAQGGITAAQLPVIAEEEPPAQAAPAVPAGGPAEVRRGVLSKALKIIAAAALKERQTVAEAAECKALEDDGTCAFVGAAETTTFSAVSVVIGVGIGFALGYAVNKCFRWLSDAYHVAESGNDEVPKLECIEVVDESTQTDDPVPCDKGFQDLPRFLSGKVI